MVAVNAAERTQVVRMGWCAMACKRRSSYRASSSGIRSGEGLEVTSSAFSDDVRLHALA